MHIARRMDRLSKRELRVLRRREGSPRFTGSL
jgi:hypothetical protein